MLILYRFNTFKNTFSLSLKWQCEKVIESIVISNFCTTKGQGCNHLALTTISEGYNIYIFFKNHHIGQNCNNHINALYLNLIEFCDFDTHF